MKVLAIISSVIILSLLCRRTIVDADVAHQSKEHVEHAAHIPIDHVHYSDDESEHNEEFDHEAILGSRTLNKEFSHLEPQDAKERLAKLVARMDTNSDGYVTKNELTDWIHDSFKMLDEEEAEEKIPEHDENKDGEVSWEEYLQKVFNYQPQDILEWEHDKNRDVQEFYKMIKAEETKFRAADLDKDGRLNAREFSAFMHPYDYEYMYDFEINRTMAQYDTNNDGVVTLDEYLGEPGMRNREHELVDTENFRSYDTDANGRLDRVEIRQWAIPDHRDIAAEEADHLVRETDTDRDGRLGVGEIVEKYSLWVGSQVTRYGQQLKRHDSSEL